MQLVLPLPSLIPFPPPFFPSLSIPTLPFLVEVGPWLRLGSLGKRLSSPSGSWHSPAAKRILAHFRHKFAPFLTAKWRIIFNVGSPLKEALSSLTKSSFVCSNSSVGTQKGFLGCAMYGRHNIFLPSYRSISDQYFFSFFCFRHTHKHTRTH